MSNPIQQDVLTVKVQNCLQNVIKKLGVTNYLLNIAKNIEYGANYLGVIILVQIIDEENKKINIAVKKGPTSSLYREFFPINSVFLRENYVYNKVLPEFERFQKNKNVKKTFGYFPKYYDAVTDFEDEFIILENIKELGYQNVRREIPLNHSHALLVVRELGKLHAISFAMKDQDQEVFTEMSRNMEDSYYSKFSNLDAITDCYSKFTEGALHSLNKCQELDIYHKIDSFKGKYYKTVCEVTSSKNCQEHAVICHGDVWNGNLLFRYLPNGVPESVCFLDWQCARYGSPVLDLVHLLFTCTDKPFRDQHYYNLIDAYYQSLCESLEQLGGDPNKIFPKDIFQEHLKKFSVFGLCMALHVLWSNLNVPKEDYYDLDTATDKDIDTVIDYFNKPPSDAYKLRMHDVILDYFNFGYEL